MWNRSLTRKCLTEVVIPLLFTWSPKIMNQTLEKSQNPTIFHSHVGSVKPLILCVVCTVCSLLFHLRTTPHGLGAE